VDHVILKQSLISVGLSQHSVGWLENEWSERSRCVKVEGVFSSYLSVNKGVPQGLVLGPLLFILYIDNLY